MATIEEVSYDQLMELIPAMSSYAGEHSDHRTLIELFDTVLESSGTSAAGPTATPRSRAAAEENTGVKPAAKKKRDTDQSTRQTRATATKNRAFQEDDFKAS